MCASMSEEVVACTCVESYLLQIVGDCVDTEKLKG